MSKERGKSKDTVPALVHQSVDVSSFQEKNHILSLSLTLSLMVKFVSGKIIIFLERKIRLIWGFFFHLYGYFKK